MEINAGKYLRLSASGQVKATAGLIAGFFVASNSSGTVKLWDDTTATGTVILNTFTIPAVGVYNFPVPIAFNTGCYATLGGTADITFFYK